MLQMVTSLVLSSQVAYLQSLRQNENERTAMQVREAEAKRDAEISAKNEKLQQELTAIRQSHSKPPCMLLKKAQSECEQMCPIFCMDQLLLVCFAVIFRATIYLSGSLYLSLYCTRHSHIVVPFVTRPLCIQNYSDRASCERP